MKKVRLITDGACKGNPGRGGWACILKYNNHSKELYGFEPHTTNNKMEITAALRGLQALREPCEVEVKTDSEYLRNGITSWIKNWKRNGWRTGDKKPVANKDLWEALDSEVNRHKTTWVWTKGHADDSENNRCDELAQMAAIEQIGNAQ
ncbi:MAG: ribonuclease HI [Bryobacteraceae bacterium]